MVEPVAELNEPLSLQTPDIVDPKIFQLVLPPKTDLKISKQEVRSTLKASTLDGVFAAVFESATTGVLLSNFLLQLGASSVEIGIFSAIPMVVNLLQPLGAYIADRTTSRHWYNLFVFGVSRLLWLVLAVAIVWGSQHADLHQLLQWTLVTVVAASVLAAFANSSWFSWMAAVVPQRLRGRYFGFRNSAVSLITLLGVPLMGLGVSTWGADPIFGYGIVLLVAVLAGMISLGCQSFMVDVNPQVYKKDALSDRLTEKKAKQITDFVPSVLKNSNFLMFILYFSIWTFAINLSAPFFNIYLLKDLSLDVSWVTIYTSLSSGANLLLLMFWGKLADRWGNRPLLIAVGLVVALTPLLWLGTGNYPFALWVWLPLLHLLGGTTLGAIGLCTNNIQMEIASIEQPSTYFAIGAAVSGLAGALGTTAGGFLAELPGMSLGSLFALSAAVRLVGLLPLVLVREPRSQSLRSIVPTFGRFKFNRG
ncbi:major facilitator superfamily MFS_1 [Oscillatoria nigro-viridis PCC 7112]|uniref:Major facilitator superfamily MFS_1 n=1 Tax=Phormidium nigroviride PCC 7112 TaxID=179408 RepID=K9VM96_9CYAN|nr:MFS transporter [Oscillatoria nigro-viridis]AFZ08592.1 major facilitator superfamily MFS_1 [Oscillatoria nigro-viridis PCC 7112]